MSLFSDKYYYSLEDDYGNFIVFEGMRSKSYHKKVASFRTSKSAAKFIMRKQREPIDIANSALREMGTKSLTDIYRKMTPGQWQESTKRKTKVNLSISRGEKLPVSRGAGLTQKGRNKYNRETGSDLKAPNKNPNNSRHKSFCARSRSWKGERGKAARKRWGC